MENSQLPEIVEAQELARQYGRTIPSALKAAKELCDEISLENEQTAENDFMKAFEEFSIDDLSTLDCPITAPISEKDIDQSDYMQFLDELHGSDKPAEEHALKCKYLNRQIKNNAGSPNCE